jgi:sporulation protein YlmC with PRC-barrel domain
MLTSAVALALATPAWAQTATDQPATTPPPAEEMDLQQTAPPEGTAGTEPMAPESVAPAAGTTGPEQTIIPEQAETELLAADLMGTDVFGTDGEHVGKVEDLILDQQQKISGVVVGVGGFLGIGKKEVGLNWEQAQLVEVRKPGRRRSQSA